MLQLFSFVWLLAGATQGEGSRVIAQSDAGRVLYRMIACSTRQRSTVECHEEEQRRLDRMIRRDWIKAAVRVCGIALTSDEQAVVNAGVTADEAHIRNAARHFQSLAIAALRVREGEARNDAVAALTRQGIRSAELDWELAHVPTIVDARRLAGRDFIEEGRQAARDFYSRPYVLAHLRVIISERARSERATFDAAETEFWSAIATGTHTRIIDPSFRLPDRNGILVTP